MKKKDCDKYRNDLSRMIGLDLYLNSVPQAEQAGFKHKVKTRKALYSPLLSWDQYMPGLWNQILKGKMNQDQKTLETLSQKHDWDIDLPAVLANEYEALVVTDRDLVIRWVDKGFSEMTGYSARFAIGRTSGFLQGANTSDETRQRIKGKISAEQPFQDWVVNYRKNQEEYICELKVFPLRTHEGALTHYLALEREIA